MSRQVLFVQGGGEDAHAWDDKLVDNLRRALGDGYDIRYPPMPNEAEPAYAAWKSTIEKEIAGLDDGAILVAHSIGATILINALASSPPDRELAGIFLLAAPFIGESGWPSDDIKPRKSLGADLPEGVPVFLYHGSKDETAPIEHLDLYARAIPESVTRCLKDRDHQLDNDLSEVASDIRALP